MFQRIPARMPVIASPADSHVACRQKRITEFTEPTPIRKVYPNLPAIKHPPGTQALLSFQFFKVKTFLIKHSRFCYVHGETVHIRHSRLDLFRHSRLDRESLSWPCKAMPWRPAKLSVLFSKVSFLFLKIFAAGLWMPAA